MPLEYAELSDRNQAAARNIGILAGGMRIGHAPINAIVFFHPTSGFHVDPDKPTCIGLRRAASSDYSDRNFLHIKIGPNGCLVHFGRSISPAEVRKHWPNWDGIPEFMAAFLTILLRTAKEHADVA